MYNLVVHLYVQMTRKQLFVQAFVHAGCTFACTSRPRKASHVPKQKTPCVHTSAGYFSIVDVVGVLTEQPDADGARNYWKVLKNRLKEEGSQLVTNCNQLKMKSPKDGKRYKTDVANTEQLLRLIQSIPSKKAELQQAKQEQP